MPKSYRHILPSSFELWCVGFAALGLLIAGNAKLLLEHLGIIDSSVVVRSQLVSHVNDGLKTIDSLNATPAFVTFITWGIIGLVLLSLLQALYHTSRTLEYERELGTNEYVHPQGFNPKGYWRHLAVNTIVSLCLFSAFIVAAALFVLFVVPVGFAYTQQLIIDPSLQNIGTFLLGAFTIFAGTALLYLLGKVLVWHHRVSQV